MDIEKDLSIESAELLLFKIKNFGMDFLPKLVSAILVLLIGLFIIGKITKLFSKLLQARNVDRTLTDFLQSLIAWALKALLFITVISMVGVATTSFVALIGAAGLAIGVALQGTLSNFAGGVMLMLFKPFKAGDYIIAQGEEGVVESISIFATKLVKLDNIKVIFPNGPLSAGTIVNLSAEENRRVDLSVGISYSDNIKTALDSLVQMCNANSKVLKTPESFVGITEFGDSSINLTIRAWCVNADYWDVFFELNEAIKPTLDKAGISIPFPQRDVHLVKQDA